MPTDAERLKTSGQMIGNKQLMCAAWEVKTKLRIVYTSTGPDA